MGATGIRCASAAAVEQVSPYEIGREPADKAIVEFAQQSGPARLSVLFPTSPLSQITTNALHGTYRADEALSILLHGTGLTGVIDAAGVVSIRTSSEANETMSGQKLQNRWTRGILALLGAHLFAPLASAQVGAQASAGPSSLEEIVVTAERRSEDLEKTPLAVTAITGDSLTRMGVTSAADLSRVVPNLSIGADNTGAEVAIRGVVNTNITEVGDPAVAFNVDGVYLSRPRAALTALFDINHVEVLRGPQGTLYGRNATAGAINVITNQPDLAADAFQVSLGAGNYKALSATGMMNLAVSPTFALRAAFSTDYHGPYTNNSPAPGTDDLDARAARVEALWKPTSTFDALATLEYFHNGGAGGGYSGGGPLGTESVIPTKPFSYPMAPAVNSQDETVEGATLTSNWKFLPFATLTYVGNYRTDDWRAISSSAVTGIPGNCLDTANSDGSCVVTPNISLDYQTSHELRLGNDSDKLKWVVGFYWFKEHNHIANGVNPCPCKLFDIWIVEPDVLEYSRAGFGQATVSVTDSLRLTGGIRYNNDSKWRIGEHLFSPFGTYNTFQGYDCPLCTNASPDAASVRSTKTTWKLGADFDLTAHEMLFADVATGYKAGGYSDGLAPANNPYSPENITNYEIGLKSDEFNHRLTNNIDAFYAKYSNYQAQGGVLINGAPQAYTVNAAKAVIKGIELETSALLTRDDQVNFSATYLKAYFSSFPLPNGDGYNNFQAEDLSGNVLPDAPKYSVRLGYQHSFALDNGGSIVPRVDAGYVSSQQLEYHNFPVTAQGAYTRTDLSLIYNAPKTWQAQAYVRNIENKAVLATAQPDNGQPNPATAGKSAFYMPPRTYGVRVTASF